MHTLPDYPHQASGKTEDVLRDVYTRDLSVRMEATVTITAGGGVPGAVRGSGSVTQLLSKFYLNWDGTLLFDVNGPELRRITMFNAAQTISETRLTTAVVGTYNISGDYLLPFARRDLMNPIETTLPPLPVRQQLRIGVEWEQGRSNATSSAGSASLVTGGTTIVTLSNVRMQVVQNYSKFGAPPFYIPVITSVDSEQFTAANPRLRMPIRSSRRFNAILLHTYNDGDPTNDSDLINTVTLRSGNDSYIDRQDLDVLRAWVRYQYPGINSDAGWLYLPLADGGKLGNLLNPVLLSNPEFEFDVAAPAPNPGVVRMTLFELITVAGVTANFDSNGDGMIDARDL